MAFGDGRGEGFLVYFYERYLVVEVWAAGTWLFTRHLDCTPLLQVGGTRHRHLVALGWNKSTLSLSLGCVTRNADNPEEARSVHKTHFVPNLPHLLSVPDELHLGGAPVTAAGITATRTLDATISTVGGRLYSRAPLTAGELARLAGREARYAD